MYSSAEKCQHMRQTLLFVMYFVSLRITFILRPEL